MAESIPSWLNIDPIASTSRMLQGYATGAQIGESLRQGEAQAAARANQAAQFEAELAQRQAQAERQYQLHQEAEQEKAKMAARNMAGMQEYQALVASGLPKDRALMQAAPNLFYGQSDKLPGALHQLTLEQQAAENALRMEAAQKAQETNWQDIRTEQNRHNLQTEQAATEREKRLMNPVGFEPTVREIEPGIKVIQLGPNHWQYLGKNVSTGELPIGFQRSIINDQIKDLTTQFDQAETDDAKAQFKSQIDSLRQQRNRIGSKPTPASGVGMGDLKAAEQDILAPQIAPESRVTTKDQFDALAPGTVYIGKDGRKYRKP